MMITQAMKNWFRRAFAWWPWKQSAQVAYPRMSGPLNAVVPSEGVAHSSIDGTAPQTSATPRLSTLEERPGYISPVPSNNDPATSHPSLLPTSVDMPVTPTDLLQDAPSTAEALSPTPQQRLEFLRYLVKRGLVNEGHEEK